MSIKEPAPTAEPIAKAIILHVVEELNKKDLRCYDSAILNELRITPDSVLEAIVSPKKTLIRSSNKIGTDGFPIR